MVSILHAGLPDPSKTLFNDQSEMFIVQKYGNQTLTLIPKDRYGNLIPSSDGIIMLIRKVRVVGCSLSLVVALYTLCWVFPNLLLCF